MSVDNPNLIWIDCEMTGLDVINDALVEIAVLVTDSQLNILGEGIDLVIKTEQSKLDAMGEYVRKMHTDSGLLKEIENGVSLSQAEDGIRDRDVTGVQTCALPI